LQASRCSRRRTNIYSYILRRIGFAVCHQIPSRVLFIGDDYLPICARDMGIYSGFLISFILLWIFDKGERENELPSRGVLIVAFAAIVALIIDGISSYLGLRETNNTIRLLTGMATGFSLPLLLFPIFNYQLWKKSSYRPIIRETWQQLVMVVAMIFTFAIIQLAQGLRFTLANEIASTFVVVSILFTFGIINLILITLLPFWYQKADNFKQLVIPSLIALGLTTIELYLSLLAHNYLISFVA